ncbi:unnamed protein product [Caenorhabditis sp. 36 PRJEB53466]|nr:unnamed protein product [Caenorhabditis sp. 36 PRJEB53466]
MSTMSMDGTIGGNSRGSGGGGGERGFATEHVLFNNKSKTMPTIQSHNGSSNHAPIVGEQQLGISGITMATGDTGHVGNVSYMNSGMLGPTQYMHNPPQNSGHPSTSVMMQAPQNGGLSRSSPTEMNQCLQMEDSMDNGMREYNGNVHHMHSHQMQMQQQHHMQQQQQQQYGMHPSYHNQQHQQQMQQMHYHQQQYQQHQMYPPQMQQPQQSQQPQQQSGQSSSGMQHVNESSNLSSAGSISDREPDIGGTPQRPTAAHNTNTTEKKPRKRRRGAVEEQATPKHERKITEFMKVGESQGSGVARCLMNEFQQNQSSPKRQPTNQQNGSNSFGQPQPQQMNQNDITPTYWPASLGANNRATPTPSQQQHYSSDSNSNSNPSPPSTNHADRLVRQADGETQTDQSQGSQRFQSSNQSVDEVAKRDRIIEDYRRQLDELQTKYNIERRRTEAAKETNKRLLIEKNIIERKALRDKTSTDSPRIGTFKTMRTGDSFRDQWVDGWAFAELDKKSDQITAERNEIANAMALLKKRKPLGIGKEPKRPAANVVQLDVNQPSTSNANGSGDDAIFRRPEEPKEIQYQEYVELDEIYKLRRDHLKKEETDLTMERDRLDRERQHHMRELKRAANETSSQFKDHQLLHKRYLMLSLLGKGGFSEVWKAFDVEENRYVACKIHHVNKDWKEEKKANYVKHAMREKDIHKSLDHCRIVKQYDLLTIDNHSFCTVLEYCPGNDLDFYLKQNKSISEKEARSIIMQVVSALVYLNEKPTPIIHYDLKPANILLESGNTSGAIKITDFGLSKIMEGENDDHDVGIELTSQFAGTYWYLPPETFLVPAPKITSKVDVWSIGVIFYQCIYGKKPFGNELTQQKILEYNTIINAREVSFPSKPGVSLAAQDFIRRCLQYRKEDRADIFELSRHELFKPKGSIRSSIAGGSISSPSIPRSPSVNREEDNL